MRSYPWKTSKLHLERLKLFPLDYARKSSVFVADWLHEYPMIEPCSVCPSSSSSSFTANSSIVFCRQQITFRHRYIHPLCEILPPSSFSQHFMHSFFKIARRKKFLDRNYFYSIRKELYIRRRGAEERERDFEKKFVKVNREDREFFRSAGLSSAMRLGRSTIKSLQLSGGFDSTFSHRRTSQFVRGGIDSSEGRKESRGRMTRLFTFICKRTKREEEEEEEEISLIVFPKAATTALLLSPPFSRNMGRILPSKVGGERWRRRWKKIFERWQISTRRRYLREKVISFHANRPPYVLLLLPPFFQTWHT